MTLNDFFPFFFSYLLALGSHQPKSGPNGGLEKVFLGGNLTRVYLDESLRRVWLDDLMEVSLDGDLKKVLLYKSTYFWMEAWKKYDYGGDLAKIFLDRNPIKVSLRKVWLDAKLIEVHLDGGQECAI